ncbi:MAG: FAD-binding oxidoreductase [Nitrospinota bacterium]
MNQAVRKELKGRLKERVSFDKADLMVYSYDIGQMPKIIMSTIDPTPEAVVVAGSVEDVKATLEISAKHGIPVTPRGQGSSGYGGAIPTKGGILLDMSVMKEILKIDEDNMAVDVEPGVVWNELSHELLKHGMDNKVYPTSGQSSTVGGWLPQGGIGIGSMKYGSIRDVVTEIDVVGLDGKLNTWSGDDVSRFDQTCGILGIITRLRLSCRKDVGIRPYAVALPDEDSLQKFTIKARIELDPYTMILHSPDYVQMQKDAGSDEPVPEGKFLAIVGIEGDKPGRAAVDAVAKESGGSLLEGHVAEAEWKDRFYPMRIKKIGPDMVVSEFYLPDEKLAKVWRLMKKDLPNDTLGMEAVVADKGRIAVLVYIPDNSEEFLYHIRVSKSIRLLRVALANGGSIYSAGLWFASSARQVLGADKYDKVLGFKREVDSRWLINPGKIVPPSVKWLPVMNVCTFMTTGSYVVMPLGKMLTYKRSTIKGRK